MKFKMFQHIKSITWFVSLPGQTRNENKNVQMS